jgi:hypothetical protein
LKKNIYYGSLPGAKEGVIGDELLGARSGKPSHALRVADHRQVHLKAKPFQTKIENATIW